MKLSQTAAVKSLDRGLDILEYVAGCSEPPSFSQLLGSLRIPRSSLFHLLTNLLSRNFLERDPATERYRLGGEIVAIARKVRKPSLRDRVAPLLHQLSVEVSETCGFYVQTGDAVEVVASAISTRALSYTMKVGMTAPLYAVSAGKIVLSELRAEDLRRYLARARFAPVTLHTIRSKSRLSKELQKVRATGFAYSRDEFTLGITAIATAVRCGSKFQGAINLAVPTARFTPERDGEFREALRRTAQIVAEEIGRDL
ncbi:MAG TPA: IclR family transcriptional regulator [Xanthobacteraceae bacterium]|nr:IclR family transcriptional regulator [Xanthobacteraceae bacterium]